MNKTEILAPVGNSEMLTAALRCGADAVYLGAKNFNARRASANFSEGELAEAIRYCHVYGVKAYLTLNISIKDSEMAAAVDLSRRAAEMGIDGIIISDLGLARVLRRLCPTLPLHASTQLTVHSPTALELLCELGFKRVVLSRELSLEAIKEICDKAAILGIETEVFVHGALCMCVSGACYLSAQLGERSGNRGLCAGPCRLPFMAENGTGYDLSLKDLCAIDYVNQLAEIGVTSFKIEGRMKRAEYVAAAVVAYKKALLGEDYTDALQVLSRVFSRSGFTDGYLKNKLGRDMFGIRTKEDVTAANDVFSAIRPLYRAEKPRIKISAALKIKNGEPIKLTFSLGDITAKAKGAIPEPAKTREATAEAARDSISKLGSTPYILDEFSTDIDSGLSVRASELNELRRQCADRLTAERLSNPPIFFGEYSKSSSAHARKKSSPEIFCRFESAEQIPTDLSGISAVILPLESSTVPLPEGIIKAVDIPRGIRSEAAFHQRLRSFKDAGYTHAAAGNIAAARIAREEGFSLLGDFGLNIYNGEAAKLWENEGAKMLTLSPELTLSAAAELCTKAKKGIIAYGRLPLMLMANCPIKNGKECHDCDKKSTVTDRLGIKFPVRCRMGFAELLNSRPTYVLDKTNGLAEFDFITLYFTLETPDEVAEIIQSAKVGAPAKGDITRGLYFKGVL